MSQTSRYPITKAMRFIASAFGLDPVRLMLRAGLPPDFLESGERGVSAPEFYALWDALDAETDDPGLPLRLAQMVLEQSFDSAIYGFLSSPTVRIGLERKALFKPLIMPLQMQVQEEGDQVVARFGSALDIRELPSLIGWFELSFFLMSIRAATGEHVRPVAIDVVNPRDGWSDAGEFFECPIRQAADYRLVLSHEDAERPLISRNDTLWAQVEADLKARSAMATTPHSTADRVRRALVEGLPGGQVTAEQIARSLALSKRSLQRRLGEEGMSFKRILEDTRHGLALNYLQNSDMSVQEIAFLLGFRDPTSFFRAFRAWTGQTPQAVRMESA